MPESYPYEVPSATISEPPHGKFFTPDFYRNAPRTEGLGVLMKWCDSHLPQEVIQQTKQLRAERFYEIHGHSVVNMPEDAQQLFEYMCLEEGMTNARIMLAYVKFAYWENQWKDKDIDPEEKQKVVVNMQQRRAGIKIALLDAGFGSETIVLLDQLIADASSIRVASHQEPHPTAV